MRRRWLIGGGGLLVGAGLLATLFADGRLRFNTPSREDYPVRGIDVSHHQGSIDWRQVQAQGINFAYLKATEGGDWRDPRFLEYWRGAAEAGVRRGGYHFFTLCRTGAEQAANFIAVVPRGGELPPVVDLEFVGNCQERPAAFDLATDLATFVDLVRRHYGREPVFYVTYEFLDAYLTGRFVDQPLWIRDIFFRPRLPEGRRWLFWQHHNRGRLAGLERPVDLNVFAGSVASFTEFATASAP